MFKDVIAEFEAISNPFPGLSDSDVKPRAEWSSTMRDHMCASVSVSGGSVEISFLYSSNARPMEGAPFVSLMNWCSDA